MVDGGRGSGGLALGTGGGIYAILDQHRDLTPPMTKIRSESFTPILVQALSFQPTECLAGVLYVCYRLMGNTD